MFETRKRYLTLLHIFTDIFSRKNDIHRRFCLTLLLLVEFVVFVSRSTGCTFVINTCKSTKQIADCNAMAVQEKRWCRRHLQVHEFRSKRNIGRKRRFFFYDNSATRFDGSSLRFLGTSLASTHITF